MEEAKEKSPIAGAIRALAVGDLLWGMSGRDLSLTIKSGGRAEAGGRSVDLNDANEFGLEVAIELLAKSV